ncbi:NUDIX hydrolase [Planosporangium mesophilum]|uniref:NUDIX hydrolase n=2 Tax=Planosporangium mesophilum TaxID=689768 RepID=A0A8J3TKQ6_9ACTN|nr:NUDIX hydrolase [Planosporangium mesophilum]
MTDQYRVRSRTGHFTGPMFDVVTDEVQMPDGNVAKRDYMVHIGAVGVVALDDEGRVVLVRQYRHPVGQHLWELPAGLIDVAGEALDRAAVRELEEEADLTAGRLDVLVDMYPSPGCSTEVIRLFLARDLSPVPPERRHERRDEEAGMVVRRFDLDEAVAMALRGEIANAACLVGVLAAARARDCDWSSLRPLDTPFERRELALPS